ncbi:MAG: DUF2723 domain-containing protein, partial [Elusimicrobiota bacterium]
MEKTEKRLFYGFGMASLVCAFVVFFKTMSPTVSFWDCGEFIACSHTLGIPHPPGTPLFIIIGRFASIIFFFIKEIAVRINLISTFSSSITVFLCYLILVEVVKTIVKIQNEDGIWTRAIPYVSGFAGSLFVGFADTFWFNSVEAEVYGVAMLELTLSIWLILKWRYVRNTPWGDRILLLVIYMSFLFVGNHLYSMLVVPALFGYVALVDEDKRKDWRFILIGIAISTIMLSLWNPFWIGPICFIVTLTFVVFSLETARIINTIFCGIVVFIELLKLRQLELSLFSFVEKDPTLSFEKTDGLVVLVLIAIVLFSWILERNPVESKRRWRFVFWMVFLSLLGYSVHLFIPIRSNLDPFVDENNPEVKFYGIMHKNKAGHFRWIDADFDQFRYFLERKQYGSEDMVSRMFYRRGSWENQILIHPHMGYGSYLFKQYIESFFGKEVDFLKWDDSWTAGLGFFILFHIPIVMAFLYFYERNRNAALLFMGLYLACGLGLVLYMNFSDGTRPEYRDLQYWLARGRVGPRPEPVQLEVRDRDYFFTPGFMMYGLWIGLTFGALLDWLKTKAKIKGKLYKKVLSASLVIVTISPIFPFIQKYESHDRSENYVAYDYSFNLLM